jgi:hypothetical protein
VGLPEGVPFDSELAEAVTKAAHASHTPPAALHAMARTFNEVFTKRAAEAEAAAMAQRKAAQDALVAEWRGNFETNAATVRHVAGRLAETAGVEPEAVAELANNPAFARVMLQVSKLTAEDRTATPTGFGDLKSPAQKIADIKAGNDPHWSPKFNSTSERERLEAYNHIKRLREEAEQ